MNREQAKAFYQWKDHEKRYTERKLRIARRATKMSYASYSGYNAHCCGIHAYFANQAKALLEQALHSPVSIAEVDAAYAIVDRLEFWQYSAAKAIADMRLAQAREAADYVNDVLNSAH